MPIERFYADERGGLSSPEHFAPTSPKIAKALEYATNAHEGQFRKSGEPFIYHAIEVAQIISSWGLGDDGDLIVAALLHDVPEDCDTFGLEDIQANFGENVTDLVDGVTKINRQTSPDADKETLKKVASKSYLEPKVALIKIADRLHNMRTLASMKPEKQIEKSIETLEIYTKLAESLGLWVVKKELEDLSFSYLDSEAYQKTKETIDSDPRVQENFTAHLTSMLENLLAEKGVNGRVEVRLNGYWGLHKKRAEALLRGKTSIENGFKDIEDVVSFRVITNNLDNCYRAVGIVHQQFDGYVDYSQYDEYVGENRRNNGYSAIQTTLCLPQGATEIAFVTEEMERFNRKGVVCLLEDGETNLEDYVLKSVFSTEGKIMFLPKRATGVDYAYSISQRIGANAVGLIVDGVEKPLTTVIANASTIDVIIDKPKRAPDPDYLNYCLPSTRAVIIEQLYFAETDSLINLGK